MKKTRLVLAAAAILQTTSGRPATGAGQEPPAELGPLCSAGTGEVLAASSACTVETKLTLAGEWDFGDGVSLDGDTALVGAPAIEPGGAFVYVRSGATWTQTAALSPPANAESFGTPVALSGNTALVADSNPFQVTERVHVYVQDETGWTKQAGLKSSGGSDVSFGASVAILGDTALVGAPREGAAGVVYVFMRNGTTWTEAAKLAPSGEAAGFGQAVALFGDTALIGATEIIDKTGAAYVFTGSGASWTGQARLESFDGEPWDEFGFSVALSADRALVGAPGCTYVGCNTVTPGSAYVFVRNGATWTPEAKLEFDGGSLHDFFGYSVALVGDTAWIGTPGEDGVDGESSGAVHVFARDGESWIATHVVTASDAGVHDFFGETISVSGDTLLVGVPMDGPTGNSSGAAYLFEPPSPPTVYCTAGLSASGCQASIGSTGTPSATAPSGFSLVASGVEGAKDGLFFFGKSGPQASPWGNGTSLQCVSPPVSRLGLLAGSGTPDSCDGSFAQDLNAIWCPTCPTPQKNPGACATVQAQLWYRDPQSTSNQTTSLSDAIELVVGP